MPTFLEIATVMPKSPVNIDGRPDVNTAITKTGNGVDAANFVVPVWYTAASHVRTSNASVMRGLMSVNGARQSPLFYHD